jgi:hypothetical protein
MVFLDSDAMVHGLLFEMKSLALARFCSLAVPVNGTSGLAKEMRRIVKP